MIHSAETWYRKRAGDDRRMASLAGALQLAGQTVPQVLADQVAQASQSVSAWAEAAPRWLWHRFDVSPFPRLPSAAAQTARPVFVNDGRWLVQCPCGGAQYASKTDHRFFCIDCLNATANGLWVAVTWPQYPGLIEAVLDVRPTNQADWLPGETLSQLAAENQANGYPVPDVVTAAIAKGAN